jgi:hypothetical protein
MQRAVSVSQLLGYWQLAHYVAWPTACHLQALQRAVEAVVSDHAHEKKLSSLSVFVCLHWNSTIQSAGSAEL